MSSCRCEQCAPDQSAPTYTRAFAIECELRMLMGMDLDHRRAYLALVEKRRGAQSRSDLEAELLRRWASRNKNTNGARDEGLFKGQSSLLDQ